MREIENIYHTLIFWIFLWSIVIASAFVVNRSTKEIEKKDIPLVQEEGFFKVGKCGNTIILDVETGRTNGKLQNMQIPQ